MAKPMGFTKRPPKGKAISAKVCKCLIPGTRLVCADNTGAKELEIITVMGYKGVRRRQPVAGIADMVVASVKKGKPEIRKQVIKAVIIRQKKSYTRANGSKIKFEDNAAILINDDGMPRGTEIKGPVAREAVDKWNKVGTLASIVV